MFVCAAAILVLLINENASKTSDPATPAHARPSFDKGELARLIHHVVEAESVDKQTEQRKITQLNAAQPLDVNYFDIRGDGALKSSDHDIMELLQKNLVANEAHAADPSNSDHAVRVHLIKNPEVLEQYRKNLMKRHMSTSSSSDDDDSLEYDRNVESFIRRNAVFRLGRTTDQAIIRENPKFALRNGDDTALQNKRNSREDKAFNFGRNYDEYGKDRILVSFKDTHDDNDKTQHSGSKINRSKNNYNEESAKKHIWDDITKNAYRWEEKNNRNNHKKDKYNDDYKSDNYKKKEAYDNFKKEIYDGYNDGNSRSKPKELKSNDWDTKMDWDKPKKDNSWDNWKSKSMEQNANKRGDDDWKIAKKSNDWNKPKKIDDWNKSKKNDEWDEPKKSKDWDKPRNDNDWDKPKNENNWNKAKKPTKGIASFEKEPKNYYVDTKDFKKEEKKKKTTNEWDRAVTNNDRGSGGANKKPYVPKISDYYNPRPRIHENPAVLGFKPFGRTSIPFVGKKGIYEEK